MEEISTTEAQAQFRDLIARARQGEETIITDHGRPVARVVPVEPTQTDASWRDIYLEIRALARAEGIGPFTDEERRQFRDEGRR